MVFRADAAFANPEIYKVLEKRGVKYAIRMLDRICAGLQKPCQVLAGCVQSDGESPVIPNGGGSLFGFRRLCPGPRPDLTGYQGRSRWKRDYSSRAAYENSIAENRPIKSGSRTMRTGKRKQPYRRRGRGHGDRVLAHLRAGLLPG